MSLINKIPPDLLEKYLAREITSQALAVLTGFHNASIRRAIKRSPITKQPKNKSPLLEARKAFRATLAHLTPQEIQRRAHVSLSTANRIKRAAGKSNKGMKDA